MVHSLYLSYENEIKLLYKLKKWNIFSCRSRTKLMLFINSVKYISHVILFGSPDSCHMTAIVIRDWLWLMNEQLVLNDQQTWPPTWQYERRRKWRFHYRWQLIWTSFPDRTKERIGCNSREIWRRWGRETPLHIKTKSTNINYINILKGRKE